MRVSAAVCAVAAILALGGCDHGKETPQKLQELQNGEGHPAVQQNAGAQQVPAVKPEPESTAVHSTLINREGKEIGMVSIQPIEHGVRVSVHAEDLTPGSHAVHFHEHGKCDPPDFQSAGGHYNPTGAKHGMPDMDEDFNDKDHHAGDLLNQNVDKNGVMDAVMVDDTVTLNGTNALLDQDGSALIIHAKPDDYQSQPSGNAGERVACAVIGAAQTAGSTE